LTHTFDSYIYFLKTHLHSIISSLSTLQVFIDEESCIGCYQCANIAPSSFEILETGRARTHTQAKRPEVQIAISACPVNCMHHVSFDELVEMETARDVGDGRDDHRHFGFGNERLNVHTPLNVARTGSDMNHKSRYVLYNVCGL